MKSLEAAAENHDADALIDCFAPDIIIRSPITQRIRFSGIEQASDLVRRVFEIISDVRVYETVGEGQPSQVIFWRCRVRGHYLEESILLRVADDGRIKEMTVFMRPVPGLLALAVKLASSLAGRRHRLRGLAVHLLLGPIAMLSRFGEPAVVALTGAGVPVPTRER